MDRHDLWKNIDNLKRHLFLKNEVKQLIFKSIKRNKFIPYTKRYQSQYYQSTFHKNKSINKIRNRCVVSGRVWSVNRKTQYGRFTLRTEAYKSIIPGLQRASW